MDIRLEAMEGQERMVEGMWHLGTGAMEVGSGTQAPLIMAMAMGRASGGAETAGITPGVMETPTPVCSGSGGWDKRMDGIARETRQVDSSGEMEDMEVVFLEIMDGILLTLAVEARLDGKWQHPLNMITIT
ncbi:MAG: hypothetical protein LBJ16_02540 [Holosporaceae bacterium]|nr:hypothetical protein [Holosporaceae bacterium]